MALDKSTLKKIGCFFGVFACVIGAIAGTGLSAYNHEWVTAACVLVLAGCAVPTIIRMFKVIMS